MPFKSKAQQRFMFAAEDRGELPKGTAKEWADATEKKKGGIEALPEKVKSSKKTASAIAEVILEKRADLAGRGYAYGGNKDPNYKPFSTEEAAVNFDNWQTRDGKPFIPKTTANKSKFLRNLGIGAGALAALGLGGYGAYRALRKEEPMKEASMKKTADEMAKIALTRWQKELQKNPGMRITQQVTNYPQDIPHFPYLIDAMDSAVDLEKANKGIRPLTPSAGKNLALAQTILGESRRGLRESMPDRLIAPAIIDGKLNPESSTARFKADLAQINRNKARKALYDAQDMLRLSEAQEMPTFSSDIPELSASKPSPGSAIIRTSIPSVGGSASSSIPKSKFLRNLGIGAGVLGALGLGGYGAYRALRKEEPEEKQASMKKSAAEIAEKVCTPEEKAKCCEGEGEKKDEKKDEKKSGGNPFAKKDEGNPFEKKEAGSIAERIVNPPTEEQMSDEHNHRLNSALIGSLTGAGTLPIGALIAGRKLTPAMVAGLAGLGAAGGAATNALLPQHSDITASTPKSLLAGGLGGLGMAGGGLGGAMLGSALTGRHPAGLAAGGFLGMLGGAAGAGALGRKLLGYDAAMDTHKQAACSSSSSKPKKMKKSPKEIANKVWSPKKK